MNTLYTADCRGFRRQPFDYFINYTDVPMTAICRNIEIDLRDILGETELPKRVQVVNDILM